MELLKTIKEAEVIAEAQPHEDFEYTLRTAARAVVFDAEGKMAFLHVTKKHYHKLPGGGVEEGEDLITGLKRKCREEIGCAVEVTGEVGQIIEFRDKLKVRQESFCYLAKVVGEKGPTNFVEDEIEDEFKLLWVDLDEAIRLLENDQTESYSGRFIIVRDLCLLYKARELIRSSKKDGIFIK